MSGVCPNGRLLSLPFGYTPVQCKQERAMGIFSFFRRKNHNANRLYPESMWIVELEDDQIRTKDWNGRTDHIAIENISTIVIETNDTGPLGVDVWWRIISDNAILSVPGGATGETTMLERFQTFPGFENEQLIQAMRCTENREFICWKRGA